MRLLIAAVGKAKGPERELAETYVGRLNALRVPGLGPLEIAEVEDRKAGPGGAAREAALLSARIPAGAMVVALDERGKQFASTELAAALARIRDAGTPALVFVIGGADGLDPALRETAAVRLAFGPQTWPHLLVRGMLCEQLYRAGTILTGHPYHRA